MVMCRICRQRFDTEKEETVLIGTRSYYHKTCYDEWKDGRNDPKHNQDENFWYEAMIDFLYRDVKLLNMDFQKIQSQWKNFIGPKKGFTPKGIYFAIRYFYTVMKGNSEKSLGGIGIVPSIYNESAQYWIDRENKKAGTIDAIMQQIAERKARETVKIVKPAKKKDKNKWSLEDI